MKIRYLVLLPGFVVPTQVIAFGRVIPRSPIEGWNEYTVGSLATAVGACLTYVSGLALVLRERRSCSLSPPSA